MIVAALLSNYMLADAHIAVRIITTLSISICCGKLLFYKHPQFKVVCSMVLQRLKDLSNK